MKRGGVTKMKIRLISTVFLCALVFSALATIPSAHAQKVLKLASFVVRAKEESHSNIEFYEPAISLLK